MSSPNPQTSTETRQTPRHRGADTQPAQQQGPSNEGNGEARDGNPRRARGFAAMDAALQRAIASQGGRAAHASGNAHEFDSNEAREAGRKGGEAISRDRSHMARIGAKGGQARGSRRAERAANGDGSGDTH